MNYLYKRLPQGTPEVTHYRLPINDDHYQFIRESAEPIDIRNRVLDENNELVWDIDGIRATKRKSVAAELTRRLAAPVFYAGDEVDADELSHRRIASKVDEIATRLEFAGSFTDAELFWRLHDNSNKVFPNVTAYGDWLRNVLVVIAQRNADAMAWSWGLKARLDGATDMGSLEGVVIDHKFGAVGRAAPGFAMRPGAAQPRPVVPEGALVQPSAAE